MSLITILSTDDSVESITVGATPGAVAEKSADKTAVTIELKRVEFDALPTIGFELVDTKLSTSFDDIEMDIRLETGRKLPIRSAIVDDDDNGIFHFEFSQDEIPAGIHKADLVFHSVTTPTDTFRIPDEESIRLVVRERA